MERFKFISLQDSIESMGCNLRNKLVQKLEVSLPEIRMIIMLPHSVETTSLVWEPVNMVHAVAQEMIKSSAGRYFQIRLTFL
jgi:hypothetical protein